MTRDDEESLYLAGLVMTVCKVSHFPAFAPRKRQAPRVRQPGVFKWRGTV